LVDQQASRSPEYVVEPDHRGRELDRRQAEQDTGGRRGE
jgi:hypothetical protein